MRSNTAFLALCKADGESAVPGVRNLVGNGLCDPPPLGFLHKGRERPRIVHHFQAVFPGPVDPCRGDSAVPEGKCLSKVWRRTSRRQCYSLASILLGCRGKGGF